MTTVYRTISFYRLKHAGLGSRRSSLRHATSYLSALRRARVVHKSIPYALQRWNSSVLEQTPPSRSDAALLYYASRLAHKMPAALNRRLYSQLRLISIRPTASGRLPPPLFLRDLLLQCISVGGNKPPKFSLPMGHLSPPTNMWFPGTTRVFTPNCMLIGSAVFLQLTVFSPYPILYNNGGTCPPKLLQFS